MAPCRGALAVEAAMGGAPRTVLCVLRAYALRLRGLALRGDKRGISALEYGLLAMLVALSLVGAMTVFGARVHNLIANDSTPIVNVTNGLPPPGGAAPSGGGGTAPAPG
ncbi:MAG: hypothetical protein KGI51_04835 [Rhodospirillales bacterium]|nr:hypothetical protein [Rhodospirillales bacterium]